MAGYFTPASGHAKGNDFCSTPLSSSPFPPPNSFVPRQAFPRRFVSPPGPLDASPLCRPPTLEGFRFRSPIRSPNIPLFPYGSRGPYCNSPFVAHEPNGSSFEAPSSGSSYGDHNSAGSYQRGGYKSWNGTPNSRQELRRGVKRNISSFHQVTRQFLG